MASALGAAADPAQTGRRAASRKERVARVSANFPEGEREIARALAHREPSLGAQFPPRYALQGCVLCELIVPARKSVSTIKVARVTSGSRYARYTSVCLGGAGPKMSRSARASSR